MKNDNVIAAVIFLAFVAYITLKGRLRTYIGFFVPAGSTSVGSTSVGSSVSGNNTKAGDTSTNVAVGGSTPTAPSIWNFITGNWYQPAQSTTQGTLTPTGSAAAAAQGAGIGRM